jgi:DNA-binding NtrC family response regulator
MGIPLVSPPVRDVFLGTSSAIRALGEEIRCAARTDAKVLITGESGTGKELVARQIQEASQRRRGRFVAINCAGLPDTLLESELFGHVRGSFTGAYRDRVGLLQQAQGGTIFMDEVGEMSLRMQALLLRFLETGEIQPVGAPDVDARVDVRVIAATNRNLVDRIAVQEFREDLYYRLNVIHIVVPSLRERRDDVPLLFRHFLDECAKRHSVPVPQVKPEAIEHLMAYAWPGNVRELKNIVERAVVRSRGEPLGVRELLSQAAAERSPNGVAAAPVDPAVALADALFARMEAGESFWTVVYEPFMARDLTRDTVRAVTRMGLERTHGSYRQLLRLLNMKPESYKRFLNFLHKYECHVAFQGFRGLSPPVKMRDLPAGSTPPARAG